MRFGPFERGGDRARAVAFFGLSGSAVNPPANATRSALASGSLHREAHALWLTRFGPAAQALRDSVR